MEGSGEILIFTLPAPVNPEPPEVKDALPDTPKKEMSKEDKKATRIKAAEKKRLRR